jgi:DUF1680 family protein
VTADYHVSCYFHSARGLYVNLYLPSSVQWNASNGAKLKLTQTGNYPLEGNVALQLSLSNPSAFALHLRIPAWIQAHSAVSLRVNGAPVPVRVSSGFATLQRRWRDGDRIDLDLPMITRLEAIDGTHPNCFALLRGPLVLFPLTETNPLITAAQLLGAKRLPGESAWQASSAAGPIRLVPFTEINEERYATYVTVS